MKALSLFLLVLLPACTSVQPLQLQPEDGLSPLPAAWRNASSLDNNKLDQAWWQAFGSPDLDRLVRSVHTDSFNMAAAIARVEQAQKLAVVAGAPLLPEVSATGSLGRQRRMGGSSDAASLSNYSAGLAASYEIDFWGKNRAAYQGALSTLRASEFDRDSLQLTLTASVATAWIQQTGLQDRVQIAGRNLENAERVLQLVESRYRAGAATPIELAQQRGLVASQRRSQALLQQQYGNIQAALAVLLSKSVSELAIADNSLNQVAKPMIGLVMPSELLTRRPDIARAEASLLAADANIQVARATMLPSITLTGGISTGSDHLHSVFDNPLYSLAAGIAAPIFNAGRLAAQRDYAIARRQELLANYRQAIITAFADVETALNLINGIDRQTQAQDVELENAQRAFALAESRYKAGAETLLTMLDTQRTLFAAQDLAVQLHQLSLQASVDLYRALGGGWQQVAR
ncbi:efflux transporter outer membrane subunit [Methylobacillus gramineus]|uniref:efflux transporter outer membrane subunit n=1 Tax=Methylobacillus gramineus TaxID=755169 RepID=UPI001CFF6E7B|nr:efflux transporter outer membrane subunit [Methylobacillus gramineus]MCB5185749.1 efflux transporter outer membrane subunit [Methylobacillus gramineus]